MNIQKLQNIFSDSLGIDISLVKDDLAYNKIPQWDSVAHMSLIASIEEGFDIMLDASDVIDMSSFAKAKDIVAKYL
jgi:acyl carrier protein